MKFYYNKWGFVAFAKELRRASWGVSAVSAVIGIKSSSGVALLITLLAWTALQVLALILESVKGDDDKESPTQSDSKGKEG